MDVLSRVPSALLEVLTNSLDLVLPKELTTNGLKVWLQRFTNEPVNTLVLGAIIVFVSKHAADGYHCVRMRNKNAAKREKKHASRASALKRMEEQLATSKEVIAQYEEILGLKLEALLQQLQENKLKPSLVLEAFQYKALKSHKLTNCIVEPLEEAKEWAKELEKLTERGPLYGLPVALKDDCNVKGHDSVIGCSGYIDEPAKDDSVIVKVLKKQGAIPFVKTNVPQRIFSIETSNPVFGMTDNPHNPSRSAGGSSGGSAALLASGGALISTGSDLGGSIRIPSTFNGVFGFKPSSNRLSKKDMIEVICGSRLVSNASGVLSSSLEGLVIYMRAMLCPAMFELDPQVPPMPFDDGIYDGTRKLKIACYTSVGSLPPAPVCCRAVSMAQEALIRAGHEVVELTPDFGNLPRYVMQTLSGDQGHGYIDPIRYDEIDKVALGNLPAALKLPVWLRKILSVILMPVQPGTAKVLQNLLGFSSVSEWWQHTERMDEDVNRFFNFWKEHNLDGLLAPGFAIHSLLHGDWSQLPNSLAYTCVYNPLNCPAGVMPITKVTKQDEMEAVNYPDDTPEWKVMKKNMQDAVGLPVAVQCVTLPWQEELCLRMMKDISRNIPREF